MLSQLRLLSLSQSALTRVHPWCLKQFHRSMSGRSYKDAIECLNSLQTNAAALEASRAMGASRLVEFAIDEMVESLGRIGYAVSN
jgi:hypothetical protein